MKTKYALKGVAVIGLLIVLVVGTAWSQKPSDEKTQEKGNMRGPQCKGMMKLTEEQSENMETIKLEFMKETTPLKNEMKVKEAQLDAASVGDNVDIKKVNALIEEIGKLKVEMAKNRFAHKQKVRNILSDEQKIMFDANAGEKGFRGRGNGNGNKGQMEQCGEKKGGRHGKRNDSDQGCRGERPVNEDDIEILG